MSTSAHSPAPATKGREHRSSIIPGVTRRHTTRILASDVSFEQETVRKNTCPLHRSYCRRRTCTRIRAFSPLVGMSLGSLAVAIPEARDFVESLEPYFGFPLAVIDSPTLRIYPSQYYYWRNDKRMNPPKLNYSFGYRATMDREVEPS